MGFSQSEYGTILVEYQSTLPISFPMSKPNEPREYDAVLGGLSITPTSAGVLGGIEGVKQRVLSTVEYKIAALSEALNYGEEGLALVIQALNDPDDQAKKLAYELLKGRKELEVKAALRNYFKRWYPIRCDGLYKTDSAYDQKTRLHYCKYLRFYPDGIVLTMCTDASLEQVAKLLCKESTVRKDTYKVFNENIKFSTYRHYCSTDYWGIIHMHGNTVSVNHYGHDEYDFFCNPL
ncbi:GUN4 domain protein [Calothrix sp. NIES-4071]|nr:GUN4 domain protein [Calothrix sp. NIES-4071]BAZ60228.1 GUN4 domain protein [Calothrix sp. NIES-4105]